MQITALTMFYNEEKIAPFFLKHYADVDEIRVLLETDSDDRTEEICRKFPNVVIEKIHISGGIDDMAKVALVNETIREIETDWLYVLDSDEFIFPPDGMAAKDFLTAHRKMDVVIAAMYQVYRHRTDKDLDPSLPAIPQRVHGDPDLFSQVQGEHRDCNVHYVKPIVLRKEAGIVLGPGNHIALGHFKLAPEVYLGAHWQMADPDLAVDRRLKRKARISKRNRENMMGFQHWSVTAEWIRAECERHLDDPEIEELCRI